MRVDTTLETYEISMLFNQFLAIAGWANWKRFFEKIEKRRRESVFMDRYIQERYRLELEVQNIRSRLHSSRRIGLPNTRTQLSILSFVAMTSKVHSRLTDEGKNRLSGLIRSGLNSDYGLASVQHEMAVAAHYMGRGYDVDFCDIEGCARFDLLLRRGNLEVEVEAKALSGDLGRQLHRRRLYQLATRVSAEMEAAADARDGGQLAQITLPDRLYGADKFLSSIRDELRWTFEHGMSNERFGCFKINHLSFDMNSSPFRHFERDGIPRIEISDFLRYLTGTANENAVVLVRKNRAVIIVSVQSEKEDKVMPGIVRELKKAASEQLTGDRPGIIIVKFIDMLQSELLEIAEQDSLGHASPLQVNADMLLRRPDWRHVYSLMFVAPGELERSETLGLLSRTEVVQEIGKSYAFSNPSSDLDLRSIETPARGAN